MSSFAVKRSSLFFVLALFALVLGAAAEELLPKISGVGFPFLLAVVPFVARRRPILLPLAYALAAGATEDALSALPALASAGFFLAFVSLMRWTRLPKSVAFLAFALYHAYLSLWCSSFSTPLFMRLAVALPVGAVTFGAMHILLAWVERKAALDEVE